MLFFFQAEDGIRDYKVTGVQTCALPISFQRWGLTTKPVLMLLCVLLLKGCTDDGESRWLGVYQAISRACEGGGNLIIEKSAMNWGNDCTNVKISTIRVNAQEFTFKVEDRKNCTL